MCLGQSTNDESLSVVIVDRELLKEKHRQLHDMQARLLAAPRLGAERKSLQKRAQILDHEIKGLKQNFVATSEMQKAALALSDCISHPNTPPNAIASALKRASEATDATDDLALCYLMGSSEGVVKAMQRHPRHEGVVGGGCHALCNLFNGLAQLDNGDSVVQPLSRHEVGDVVISAMTHLSHARDVQFYGCRLLCVLASNMKQSDTALADEYEGGKLSLEDTIARACFFTGARVAVARARRVHHADADVTQWADCAMRLL